MKPILTYKTAKSGAEKPWLILLPGVNCGAWFFKDAFTPLSATFNVLALNNPGVDGSDLQGIRSVRDIARQVLKIMHVEGIGKAHVLGHSMGGFVAQELALLAPAKIDRLILVSTSMGQPHTSKDLLTFAKVTGKTWQQYNREVKKDRKRAMQIFFGRSFLTEHFDRFVQFIEQNETYYPGRTGSALHLALGGTFSSLGRIGNIQVPTLVIHGDSDVLITPRSAHLMAESVRHGHWWELLDVGHFPMLETPAFWPHVIAFLQGQHVGQVVEHTPHTVRSQQKLRQFWDNLWESAWLMWLPPFSFPQESKT